MVTTLFGKETISMHDAWAAEHQPYWQQRLSGAVPVTLCSQQAPANTQISDYEQTHDRLGAELCAGLQEVSRRERAPLPLVVLTVYIAVIARWCSRDDLVLTFVSNARYRPQLHNMIGYLASQLFMRVGIGTSETFLGLLRQVSREFYLALSHESFDRVYDILPEWRNPGTQLHFNWLPACQVHASVIATNEGLTVRSVPFLTTWPASFLPWFFERDGDLHIVVCHLPQVFPRTTVGMIFENMRTFARELIVDGTGMVKDCRGTF
jgi:hypothetical protein